MRLNVEFVSYILGQRTREIIRFMKAEDELKLTMLHSVLDVITNYTSPSTEVTWLATSSFRKIKSLLKEKDPYNDIKREESELSLSLYRKYVENLVSSLEEREALKILIKSSILGDSIRAMYNSIDGITSMFEKIKDIELLGAPLDTFIEDVSDRKVGFVLNNVGGVVFDLHLARTLAVKHGSYVKIYVKTDAYANDITLDALTSNYDIPDEIHVTPLVGDAAGIDKSLLRKSDLDDLWSNDVLVVKGIMNYCGLKNSGFKGTAYSMLMIPFKDLAEKMGLPWNKPVLVKVS